MYRYHLAVLLLTLYGTLLLAAPSVENVLVKQHIPWDGLVDITYSVQCDELDSKGKPKDIYLSFVCYVGTQKKLVIMKNLTGDGATKPVPPGASSYTTTWNAGKDCPEVAKTAFTVKVLATAGFAPYLVVDLSGGPKAQSYPWRYSATYPDVTQDLCRTSELWLRLIPDGTFTMGSPVKEFGRYADEIQHQVTISQKFYIGVFECTQRQWELVMGDKPSHYNNVGYYETRPVEQVTYDTLRGTDAAAGAGWPKAGHAVDAESFMGRLQRKTGLTFDLPTEAQWEYACRMKVDGSCCKTALNSGKELINAYSSCPNLAEVGRYWYNGGQGSNQYCSPYRGTAKVGSYLPSEKGLYDMHGNVLEWCLDWYGPLSEAVAKDPAGAPDGSNRVLRGGGWNGQRGCRAAGRESCDPSESTEGSGFRVMCLPAVQ